MRSKVNGMLNLANGYTEIDNSLIIHWIALSTILNVINCFRKLSQSCPILIVQIT